MTDVISANARVDRRRSAPVPPSPESLWHTTQLSAYTAEPSTAGLVVVGAKVVVGARVVVVVGGSVVVVVDSTVTGGASVVVVPPPSTAGGAVVVDGAVPPVVVSSVVVVAVGACVVVAADDDSVFGGAELDPVSDGVAGCVPSVVSWAGVAITRVVVVVAPVVGLTAAAVGGGADGPALQPPEAARTRMSNAVAGRRPKRELADSAFIGGLLPSGTRGYLAGWNRGGA